MNIVATPQTENVLGRLEGVKRNGSGWTARCPAHADRKPSLSVSVNERGVCLVHCHAGCSCEAVMDAIGLPVAALFPDFGQCERDHEPRPQLNGHSKPSQAATFVTAEDAIRSYGRKLGEPAATWEYRGKAGEHCGTVIRWDSSDGGKTFRQISRDDSGRWCMKAMPEPRPLYRLSELSGHSRVWVVEGEKCADALAALGLPATTSPGGSKAASKADWRPLAGRECIILPDSDDAGAAYAETVAAILDRLGCTVRVVELPLPAGSGDDAADLIGEQRADGKGDDAIKQYIADLAEHCEPWTDENAFRALKGGSVRETNTDPVKPVLASALGPGEAVPWAWEGFAAIGYLTLLIGLFKAGKTTLLSWLLAATGNGGDVVTSVSPCKVLIITEEGGSLWARRRDDVGIGDNVSFVIRPFKGRPSRKQWETFVHEIAAIVTAEGVGMVVFDTFSAVSPLIDENDAAGMLTALSPLHAIADAGAAVVLCHHPRKGDGNEGTASRGSGALPGFVDIILELRRLNAEEREDTRRVLTAYSRFEETPGETVIQLTDAGYVTVGSKADAKRGDRQRVIRGILAKLKDTDPALTAEAVREQWPDTGVPCPGKRTVQADLSAGYDVDEYDRAGTGKKGDPFAYRLKTGENAEESKTAFSTPVCDSRTLPLLGARNESEDAA